jgi:hypothetical protein
MHRVWQTYWCGLSALTLVPLAEHEDLVAGVGDGHYEVEVGYVGQWGVILQRSVA